MLLALLLKEDQLAFELLAQFHLRRVWKVVGRLFLVEVDELGFSYVTKLINDSPRVILWHC